MDEFLYLVSRPIVLEVGVSLTDTQGTADQIHPAR